MRSEYENAVIRRLIDFGEKNDLIRAVVLTSSLSNPHAPVDILSDFDIQLFFEDPAPFLASEEWIGALGPVMALWRDEWGEGIGHRRMRMVYFQDGTKMDIQLAYLEDLRRISRLDSLPAGYDIGYEVLLDKDGVTSGMRPPTYKAYIISAPTDEQYIARIEGFWMDCTYAAKYLWREDIMAAKAILNHLAEHDLREVLEWSVAMGKDWTWKPGSLGRGLEKALDTATRRELMDTYAGGDIDEIWESLYRTAALFRKAATRVGRGLGFEYPGDLDSRVTEFLGIIRSLDRQTATREELAELLAASTGD